MAAFTRKQHGRMRRLVVKEGVPIDFTKANVDGSIQALEDWFETRLVQRNQELDAGALPARVTAQQRRAFEKAWHRAKGNS